MAQSLAPVFSSMQGAANAHAASAPFSYIGNQPVHPLTGALHDALATTPQHGTGGIIGGEPVHPLTMASHSLLGGAAPSPAGPAGDGEAAPSPGSYNAALAARNEIQIPGGYNAHLAARRGISIPFSSPGSSTTTGGPLGSAGKGLLGG